MRACLVLLGLTVAAACASAPAAPPAPPIAPPVEVAFERRPDGRLLVDASVDGQGPFALIVDTGAGVSVLDRALIDALGLAPAAFDVRVYGVTSVVTSAAFGPVTLGLGEESVLLDWVAGLELSDRRADGVIGVDVLSRFALQIDGVNRVLRLGRTRYEAPRRDILSRQPLVIGASGLPEIEIRINSSRTLALIDTGLAGVIVDPTFARRARIRPDDEPLELTDLVGGSAQAPRSAHIGLDIGRAHAPAAHVALFRPPALDLLDEVAPTSAILGAGVFEQVTLVIDFPAGAVLLTRPRKPPGQ